jgi:hypothetical protein
MKKILRKGVNIDKLAHQLASKKGEPLYNQGHPEEKVWINFQSSKDQKRQFAQLCKDNNINASGFLRACVKALLESEGNVSSVLKKLKSTEDKTLDSKATSS